MIIIILGFGYAANAQTTTKTDLILLQDKSEINGIIEEISRMK
ncbi:MAG: hypothetical protein U5N85_09990 [Arcicella sp.]|nr:hypothetical protein [Arcicella sp.]